MKKILISLLGIAMLWSCGHSTAPQPHPEWTYNTVVYEMNVRQLTPESSFREAEAYLPALKELGIDIVWVMPIYPIGVKERKGTLGSYYAISNYCAVNPEFGTMEDFDSFLATAHRLGLKVVLDWVANHTSPDALWITEKPADWYVRDENGETIIQYDWTDIAKLNYDQPDMRQAMLDAMKFWVNKGVDGFRCDMACEVPIDFWRAAFAELRKINPDLYLLAEGERTDLHEKAFDASYAWNLHHLLNDIAQGKKGAADLKAYIEDDAATYPHEAFRLMFTSNHDENSWAGTEFARMGDAARAMAVLTFVLPNGQPLIYTGQEFGYDHSFEFFEKDPMPSLEPNDYTDFYKRLCTLHHDHSALASGEKGGEAVFVEGLPECVFAFTRSTNDDMLFCAFNLSDSTVSFTVPEAAAACCPEWNTGDEVTLSAWEYTIDDRDGHQNL